jgi:hypothetical protein
MKIFSTLMLLLTWSLTFAQQKTNKINQIKQTVEQINKGKNYTTKILDGEYFLEDMTDNGGRLTGYFKNGKLVKMEEIVGLSSCENKTMYYLKDNKLIFTYTRGTEDANIDNTENSGANYVFKMECRFYFDNGKVIKSILKGETICSGKPLESDAKTYQKECSRYIKLLKAK